MSNSDDSCSSTQWWKAGNGSTQEVKINTLQGRDEYQFRFGEETRVVISLLLTNTNVIYPQRIQLKWLSSFHVFF